MRRFAWLFSFGLFGFGLLACGSSEGDGGPSGQRDTDGAGGGLGEAPLDGAGGSSSGGTLGGGGVFGNGGAAAVGGSGVTESGGSTGSGGAPGGPSAGGYANSGGAQNTGGQDTGGEPSTGGQESSGVGGSEGGNACPFAGNVTYELNNPDTWPDEIRTNITEAMDEAVYYYNCYADLEKHITVNYNPGVPTAEANVDGWLSFGSNLAYMQTATAMHEVAHTLGVGYYPWAELIQDGRWVGPSVVALMNSIPSEERDQDMYSLRTYITCDAQHFWPYGLNQAAEYQSEWSLINHVRIVAAMNQDKVDYLSQ